MWRNHAVCQSPLDIWWSLQGERFVFITVHWQRIMWTTSRFQYYLFFLRTSVCIFIYYCLCNDKILNVLLCLHQKCSCVHAFLYRFHCGSPAFIWTVFCITTIAASHSICETQAAWTKEEKRDGVKGDERVTELRREGEQARTTIDKRAKGLEAWGMFQLTPRTQLQNSKSSMIFVYWMLLK